jgi:hypothetical protein
MMPSGSSERLKEADPTGHTGARNIVAVLAGIGDLDGAFEWIDLGDRRA